MKKENKIYPIGLKGNQINERMKELMGIAPINESVKTSVVELTKFGPDGKAYAIVRENHEYYIKKADKISFNKALVIEDFKYIGGLMNKKSEAYPSYAKAIKQLNLKFRNLAEANNFEGVINIFVDDNLLTEAGIAGFSNYGGNGFSGEGNLTGNTPLPMTEEKTKNNPWAICTASVGRDSDKYEACVKDVKKEKGIDETITENEYCGDGEEEAMTEEETAIDAMTEEEGDKAPKGETEPSDAAEKPATMNEHKLTILRALENMDAIIDGLTEGNVKKKVYTIR